MRRLFPSLIGSMLVIVCERSIGLVSGFVNFIEDRVGHFFEIVSAFSQMPAPLSSPSESQATVIHSSNVVLFFRRVRAWCREVAKSFSESVGVNGHRMIASAA